MTDRIPVITFHCVPKQITRQVPYPVCETVAETCYRPVTRMVACDPARAGPGPPPTRPQTPTPQG